MTLREAMEMQDSLPDSVLYRLSDYSRLIGRNTPADRFYEYRVFGTRGDYDRAYYGGRIGLKPSDVLADDWQVRVEPFVVED